MKLFFKMVLILYSQIFGETMIPREEFFRLPSCMAIKISPNGKQLAYVGEDHAGTMNLYVSPNLSLEEAKQITHFETPSIKGFYWTSDSHKMILLKDEDGTHQFHLYRADLISGKLENLTRHLGSVNVKVFEVSAKENKAVVGINQRNPKFSDLYLLDLNNGALEEIEQNDKYIHYLFDENLNIAIKLRLNSDSSQTLVDHNEKILFTISPEDAFNTRLLKFNREDNSLYILDNRENNTTQLKKIYLNGKKQDMLFGDNPFSDILDVYFENGIPRAYSTYYTQKEWHALDEVTRNDIDHLISTIGNNFSIADSTREGKVWVVSNSLPEKGNTFWLYHRPNRELTLLHSFPNIDSLSNMYSLETISSDGLPLISYLTLPKEMDMGGKPKQPLPLVVNPHGGPFKIRDYYQYNPYHQWLSNRGYAVLSVNFRLSSGLGKDFVTAGNSQWGRKAHQDIIDVIQECIDSGITEKGKIAFFGGSYGGYEALASLTFTPDLCACAISICGPSRLKSVLEKTMEHWELCASPLSDHMHLFTRRAFVVSMGGDPSVEADTPFLESCSPLCHVSKIQKPLLLVHGGNDPIVVASESDQIFESMSERGLPAVYLFFADEGHGITKKANKMCYLAYSEWLLAQFLGGKYEPISNEQLEKANVTIRSSNLQHENVIK